MMKTLRIISIGTILGLGLALSGCAQNTDTETAQDPVAAPAALVSLNSKTIEVGCAMCVYDIDGVTSCKLAAKIDDNPMLVSGAEVDLHEHGLCEAAGMAVVSGRVDGDMLVATTVEMQ